VAVKAQQQHETLVDGKLVSPATRPERALVNLATGKAADVVPESGTKEVELAVAAAKAAFEGGRWSRIGPSAPPRSVSWPTCWKNTWTNWPRWSHATSVGRSSWRSQMRAVWRCKTLCPARSCYRALAITLLL
jgi:hypothetical protein